MVKLAIQSYKPKGIGYVFLWLFSQKSYVFCRYSVEIQYKSMNLCPQAIKK